MASPGRGDEAAIREVVRKYDGAREARDPKAIEALLTADADQLVSDGKWRKGRDELVRGMLESSRRTGGRRDIAVESVRMLADDVALAFGFPIARAGCYGNGSLPLGNSPPARCPSSPGVKDRA